MKHLAVLISNSGTGSNLQAIIDAIANRILTAKIVVVISDKEDALGLKRAQDHHIPTALSHSKEELLPLLRKYNPDYICLTGWKQIISKDVIDDFTNRILNLHPGLIPDTPDGAVNNPDGTPGLWNQKLFGDNAIANVLSQKATYAGASIHFLTQEFDFGPVLARAFEKVHNDDTTKTLYTRLKQKEHMIYIQALKKLCNT